MGNTQNYFTIQQKNTIQSGVLMVTVIIPIFNRIKTLNKCVDSVLSQTYSDLDIILVDDGSNDSSGNLCDKYMQADPRIRVIHEEHQGVALARNQGIKIAKGEYITFIDSDDYVMPDYVEKLVEAIEKNNSVLAICNSYNSRDGKLSKRKLYGEHQCLASDFIKDTFYSRIEGESCWGKLYKTCDIKHIFREFNYCEDIFYVFEYLAGKDEYVTVVPEFLYYYVRHEDSITGLKRAEDLMDVLRLCEEISNTCHDKYPQYAASSDALLVNNAFFVYLNSKKHIDSKGNELRAETKKIIKEYRKDVLHDREASAKTKGACILSYISFGLLSFIYRFI